MEKKMSNMFLHARLVRNKSRMNCQKMKLEQHIKMMGKVLGIGCTEHRLSKSFKDFQSHNAANYARYQDCFTKQIVAFHETLAQIGKYKQSSKTNSIVWHKGVPGRLGEDNSSVFLQGPNRR